MSGLPDVQMLYEVTEHTWPAAKIQDAGAWTLRDGQGGGKRVSAATARGPVSQDDLHLAENAMKALGQTPLFMIRAGEEALDRMLDDAGYAVIDPVNLYVCDIEYLTTDRPPKVTAFDIWPPLAIQADIWNAGGIGPARRDVMARVSGPKTALLGRESSRPAATGFVAIHKGVAMIHALEVLAPHRGRRMGTHLTRHAAFWAADQGATHLAVLCTKANQGANALYSSLGMTVVGQYHYRIKEG
ncbi:MAG: GNAT family N-acetyltransferase [Pseudomonadota bacterium]